MTAVTLVGHSTIQEDAMGSPYFHSPQLPFTFPNTAVVTLAVEMEGDNIQFVGMSGVLYPDSIQVMNGPQSVFTRTPPAGPASINLQSPPGSNVRVAMGYFVVDTPTSGLIVQRLFGRRNADANNRETAHFAVEVDDGDRQTGKVALFDNGTGLRIVVSYYVP